MMDCLPAPLDEILYGYFVRKLHFGER